jgi:hypothetical protein
MALAQVLDLEDVDQSHRDLYTQADDGSYRVDIEDVDGLRLANPDAVDRKNRQLLRELKKHKERSAAFGDLDVEAAREALARVPELEERLTKGQGDLEQIVNERLEGRMKRANAAHKNEKETLQTRAQKLEAALRKNLVEGAAASAIAEMGGAPQLLMGPIRDRVRAVEDEDGNWRTEVLEENGEPAYRDGSAVSLKTFVSDLKADPLWGRAFEGSGATGSGASGSSARNAGRAGGAPKHRGDFTSLKDKAAFVHEHGLEKFKALPLDPGQTTPFTTGNGRG